MGLLWYEHSNFPFFGEASNPEEFMNPSMTKSLDLQKYLVRMDEYRAHWEWKLPVNSIT